MTRAVLDHNPSLDTSMWCWCTQCGYYEEEEVQACLDSMAVLESEYPGVTFVYFTGNAQGTGSAGWNRWLRNAQIRDYCRSSGRLLFDFEDLDSWWYNHVSGREHHTYLYNSSEIPAEHPHFLRRRVRAHYRRELRTEGPRTPVADGSCGGMGGHGPGTRTSGKPGTPSPRCESMHRNRRNPLLDRLRRKCGSGRLRPRRPASGAARPGPGGRSGADSRRGGPPGRGIFPAPRVRAFYIVRDRRRSAVRMPDHAGLRGMGCRPGNHRCDAGHIEVEEGVPRKSKPRAYR